MAHEMETMFYVRETPWHGLGTKVDKALSSEEAIKVAGLDWDVVKSPISVNGVEQKEFFANVRSSDNKMLGIVTDKYKIVQNSEAFAFTDALLGMDVEYETAGSLFNGKRVWMLAKLPETFILDDKFIPYLVFTTAHDGKGSVRAAISPTRVVCWNTLSMAMVNAVRTWSMKHTGDINSKMESARYALDMSDMYMKNLQLEAETLAKKTMSMSEVKEFAEMLFPMPDMQNISNCVVTRIGENRANLIRCYEMSDLDKYRGTQYAVINAVSDFATHIKPHRETNTYRENNFMKIIDGNSLIDMAYSILKAA